jgi:GT2 family glycosyltransferase
MSEFDVTVVLHTRNRATDLRELFGRLRTQDTAGAFRHQVLVVDNGSSDDTAAVIAEAKQTSSVPLETVEEPRVGRPFALNTGIARASSPILAFTDDDTLPEPDWLLRGWRCLVEEDADAVGGRVLPEWCAQRPSWLTDEVVGDIGRLGLLDLGSRRLRSRDGETCRFFTSNLFLRRDAVRALGGWDVKLRYYQDTDLLRRARAAGWAMAYEPAAVVRHKIGADRMTPEYFRRRRSAGAAYQAQLAGWRHRAPWVAAGRWILAVVRGEPWGRRFARELDLRDALRVWRARLGLWPR